jgi:predicted aspartyl protease
MGQFWLRVKIAHPTDASRFGEIDLLVDTGATLSGVPRELLERLGVSRLSRRAFVADGRTIERETAGALVLVNGSEAHVTVVVAEPGDGHLLGATTLEARVSAWTPSATNSSPRRFWQCRSR